MPTATIIWKAFVARVCNDGGHPIGHRDAMTGLPRRSMGWRVRAAMRECKPNPSSRQ
jgi:hypothetical protein